MSTFAGIPFKVLAEGRAFPAIWRDGDGRQRWAGRVRFASRSDRNAMAAKLCLVTPKRVYGRIESNLHVEAGPGGASLVVPTAAGVLGTHTALLVGMTNVVADGGDTNRHLADLEFLLP